MNHTSVRSCVVRTTTIRGSVCLISLDEMDGLFDMPEGGACVVMRNCRAYHLQDSVADFVARALSVLSWSMTDEARNNESTHPRLPTVPPRGRP